MKLSEINNQTSASKKTKIIDNKNGLGAVPYNQEVDYMGLRVSMKPSVFLSLVPTLKNYTSKRHFMDHLKSGGRIGSPFLLIDIPEDWEYGDFSTDARVRSHDGRNRMMAIRELYGDLDVETHLFFASGVRRRHLTPAMIDHLKQQLKSEISDVLVKGPLFESRKILEGLSDILYHSTTFLAARDIIMNNEFLLSPDIGTSVERELRPKEKQVYYLSTSRSKMGEYRTGGERPYYGTGQTLFVLDGRRLSHNYSGRPVDYWQGFGMKSRKEMEDRIFSSKPKIQPASDYIQEIHMFTFDRTRDREFDDSDFNVIRNMRKMKLAANRMKIPMYFYDDMKAYTLLDTSNAIPLSKFKTEGKSKPSMSMKRRSQSLAPYMELLNIDDVNSLSKQAKRKLYDLSSWYRDDIIRSISADFHNVKRSSYGRSESDNLIREMQKRKLYSVSALMDYIKEKFQDQI